MLYIQRKRQACNLTRSRALILLWFLHSSRGKTRLSCLGTGYCKKGILRGESLLPRVSLKLSNHSDKSLLLSNERERERGEEGGGWMRKGDVGWGASRERQRGTERAREATVSGLQRERSSSLSEVLSSNHFPRSCLGCSVFQLFSLLTCTSPPFKGSHLTSLFTGARETEDRYHNIF